MAANIHSMLRGYQAAERELALRGARTGFLAQATAYALVIPLLIAINLVLVPQIYFFAFPMLGWGLGLPVHYLLGYRKAHEQVALRQAQAVSRHLSTDHGRTAAADPMLARDPQRSPPTDLNDSSEAI